MVGPSESERGELSDDALTETYRVLQRVKGHRYSIDDVLTASIACEQHPTPHRYLDLGCGIGSVLLMVQYKLGPTYCAGIEGQQLSFDLLQQNLKRNAVHAKVIHGDFRERHNQQGVGSNFDLITGTPPYMPEGTSTPSPDSQRAYARIEYRGGVDAYIETAATLLNEVGTLVVCSDARAAVRVQLSAKRAGLSIHKQVDMIPRPNKPPLFSVWVLRRDKRDGDLEHADFVARSEIGERTDAYRELRAFFGLPSSDRMS